MQMSGKAEGKVAELQQRISFGIVTLFLISANYRTNGPLSRFFNLFVSPTFYRCCPRHTMTSKER
jgi:hypothetical protein